MNEAFPWRSFVEGGFTLPESQGSASWVDKDTLLVSRDFGRLQRQVRAYKSELEERFLAVLPPRRVKAGRT